MSAAASFAVAVRAAMILISLGPWLLPILRARLPLGALGVALDAAFATTCHRLPERSLALMGVAMPVCSRCGGIYAGVVLGAIVARPKLSARPSRIWITAAVAAMLIDVVTQDLGLRPMWHAARLASGAAFGYLLGVAVLSALQRRASVPS